VGLLQDFLNTTDIESETDLIATPVALADWMRAKKLRSGGGTVVAGEHALVLELRELVRDALEAATHGADAGDANARLDAIAATVPLRVRFGREATLQPADARVAALGPILATVYDAQRDDGLARLKVCRNEACRWAFYDTSRNRSGLWCSMAICGNRQKGRLYRRRHARAGAD
jgi:predicted RNA-binding Zn ribbon-like protein